MTEAIVWGVIWLILTPLLTWLIYAAVGFGLGAIAVATEKVWIGVLGIALGFLAAASWFVFAAVHFVLQVIDVVRLATGG